MKRVAIVGGGMSGLSAAYQLACDGQCEFALYEASQRLGGIVETVHQDGFLIECGPDAWVTDKPWARELAIELGLEDEIIPSNDRQRRTYLLQGRQLMPIPDGMRMMVPTRWAPIMDSPLFSWQARLAYLREPRNGEALKASALNDHEDESVAAFVTRHFGPEVIRTIAGPLLAGIFGGDIETLSARAVMPAFVKMEREEGSLIAALQKKQAAQTEAAAVFTTLRSGLGTLVDRMQSVLPAQSLRLQNPVIGIARDGSQWEITTQGSREHFDAVIVAAPAYAARELLRPVHEGVASLLTIEATSAIVVALPFSAEQAARLRIPRGFGYLVPPTPTGDHADPQLLACTFMDQKYPHRAPEGAVLLRAFFGGATAKALLHCDDQHLAGLAHRHLSFALGPLPAPLFTVVRRWPLSLPQYAVGHGDRMEQLVSLVKSLPGLHLVGNTYRGVGIPDMVRLGRDAARAAAGSG